MNIPAATEETNMKTKGETLKVKSSLFHFIFLPSFFHTFYLCSNFFTQIKKIIKFHFLSLINSLFYFIVLVNELKEYR